MTCGRLNCSSSWCSLVLKYLKWVYGRTHHGAECIDVHWLKLCWTKNSITSVIRQKGRKNDHSHLFSYLVEDGIAEGLQNWFKILNHLYVDLIEPRKKNDAKVSMTKEEFAQAESALQEQRLNTIYTVSFYIDSFFSVASAIIELQKFTRYLRVRTSISFWINQNRVFLFSRKRRRLWNNNRRNMCDLSVIC